MAARLYVCKTHAQVSSRGKDTIWLMVLLGESRTDTPLPQECPRTKSPVLLSHATASPVREGMVTTKHAKFAEHLSLMALQKIPCSCRRAPCHQNTGSESAWKVMTAGTSPAMQLSYLKDTYSSSFTSDRRKCCRGLNLSGMTEFGSASPGSTSPIRRRAKIIT